MYRIDQFGSVGNSNEPTNRDNEQERRESQENEDNRQEKPYSLFELLED
jgi:hypothetical protein